MQEIKDALSWQIEVLGKRHDRSLFSCGNVLLDQYLRTQAGQDARKRATVPFVLCEGEASAVLGYYTLSNLSVDVGAWPEEVANKLPRYPLVPTTLLGRLAIDRRFQGRGVGEYLLMDALYRCLRTSREVASVAVIVDAIDDRAIAFYRHYEFKAFDDDSRKLFLRMSTIERLFT